MNILNESPKQSWSCYISLSVGGGQDRECQRTQLLEHQPQPGRCEVKAGPVSREIITRPSPSWPVSPSWTFPGGGWAWSPAPLPPSPLTRRPWPWSRRRPPLWWTRPSSTYWCSTCSSTERGSSQWRSWSSSSCVCSTVRWGPGSHTTFSLSPAGTAESLHRDWWANILRRSIRL